MNNRNLSLALIIAALHLSGCVFDEDDHKLVLYNNSTSPIYFYALTDTILGLKNVTFLPGTPYLTLMPKDSGYPLFARKGEDWKQKIDDICRDSLLRLFVFKVDTVNKYGWKNIIKLKKYYRFDLGANKLDSLNWHVIYNGGSTAQ